MMLSNTTKRWLATGATVLAVGGGGGLALAQQGGSASTPPSTQSAPDPPGLGDTSDRAQAADTGEHDNELPAGASGVQAPDTPDRQERSEAAEAPGHEQAGDEQSSAAEREADRAEKAESAKLASLAKVDRAQAERAALAEVPGTVTDAQLGNENGNVIWEVDVKGSDGAQHEVKIDAGNGTVLAAHVDAED